VNADHLITPNFAARCSVCQEYQFNGGHWVGLSNPGMDMRQFTCAAHCTWPECVAKREELKRETDARTT
jgi:hypothetical protein